MVGGITPSLFALPSGITGSWASAPSSTRQVFIDGSLSGSWGSQQLLTAAAASQQELLDEPQAAQGVRKALLGSVPGSAGAGRVVRTELGWSRLYSLQRGQQNNSLSDSFLRLQTGPKAADGC